MKWIKKILLTLFLVLVTTGASQPDETWNDSAVITIVAPCGVPKQNETGIYFYRNGEVMLIPKEELETLAWLSTLEKI